MRGILSVLISAKVLRFDILSLCSRSVNKAISFLCLQCCFLLGSHKRCPFLKWNNRKRKFRTPVVHLKDLWPSAKQNRPLFMKSLYLWLHYFCLETHSLVSCIKVVRFSWCREISLSLWDANNEKHQNNKVCDKQLPVLWIKQTHFWRGCHDYIFNYSQMYIEKSNCLICLLLISVPLGLLSRMTLQA